MIVHLRKEKWEWGQGVLYKKTNLDLNEIDDDDDDGCLKHSKRVLYVSLYIWKKISTSLWLKKF